MNERHQIMTDTNFWLRLEFNMSGRLSELTNREIRKYWIDGFIPQFITDTKSGVNVEGEIWVAEGNNSQIKCTFLATIPQKLLYRNIQKFDYEIVTLDIDRKYVELNIESSPS